MYSEFRSYNILNKVIYKFKEFLVQDYNVIIRIN